MRAIWDGWVALVDKNRSAKFQTLVNHADDILANMPWPKTLENDKFITPDFTSLNIVTFGGDRCPQGINIPNYSDIRENEGFKNVIFESNKPVNRSLWERMEYVTQEDSDFLHEHMKDAMRVLVAGHELFGHGSGKLLYRGKDGKCPLKVKVPVDGSIIDSCYEKGENYQSRFGEFSSSYEECRADLSGLYLQ